MGPSLPGLSPKQVDPPNESLLPTRRANARDFCSNPETQRADGSPRHFDSVWEFSVRALEQVTHEEERVEKSTHAVVSKQDARGELESEIHRRSSQLKIEAKGDPGATVDVARTEAIGIVATKPRTEADDPSHSQIQVKSEIGFVSQDLRNTPFVISMKSKSGSPSDGEVKGVGS